MLAVSSNEDELAFRFGRSIANRRRYRPVCLKKTARHQLRACAGVAGQQPQSCAWPFDHPRGSANKTSDILCRFARYVATYSASLAFGLPS